MKRRNANQTGSVASNADEKIHGTARRESTRAVARHRTRRPQLADPPAPPGLPTAIENDDDFRQFCRFVEWLRHVVLIVMYKQRFWEEPDDLLNSALVATAKHLHEKGPIGDSVAFFAVTVRYSIYSVRRTRARQAKHLAPYRDYLAARRNADDPEEPFVEAPQVRAAMETLAPTERITFAELSRGKTLQEIADQLDSSVATVHRRKTSALAKLRAYVAA